MPPPPPPKLPGPQQPLPVSPQIPQLKRRDLVARITDAIQRLIPHRAKPRPPGKMPTGKAPGAEVASGPHSETDLSALYVRDVRLTAQGQQVLADVSFTAQRGTLTAIVAPSAPARSGLITLLGGAARPSSGDVTLGGHHLHTEPLGPHVSMVPRNDPLHPQLTIEQALGYIAELRLPPSISKDERRRIVDQAIGEVALDRSRTTQIGALSHEQRKLAALAAELITAPSLLVLEDPTAGLDPQQQRQLMTLLWRLAKDGRIVVLSTTAVDHVEVCDQVVLLTSAGSPAYIGPPDEIQTVLGGSSWPDIMTQVATDPEGAHRAFLARESQPKAPPPGTVAPLDIPRRPGLWRQIGVAARRQAWLIAGDQRYFIFLTILPLLFGGWALVVPGHAGLGAADPYGNSPDEALEILVVLNLAAVAMGTALGIRDVFRERHIFRREQAEGLSTPAYLTAKVLVYAGVLLVQTGVITLATAAGKGAPARGAVLLGSPVLELYLSLALTAIVSAIVALALSSLARYREQVLLMAVVVILVSLLFCGGVFPLAGRFALEQVSWLLPAQWGFAASASTIDVHAVNVLADNAATWNHSAGQWLFDLAMLIALGAAASAFLWRRLRRTPESHSVSDTGPKDAEITLASTP
ncbi:hypothetical protein AWC26_04205 [Mycobacterium shimoidei]|nr:hypothetical protein AWC26_04205 [Mycobacterium shimoidei]